MSNIIFSTVILNWNRDYLLEQTLSSYKNTVTVPHELYVIDNHSQDQSINVMQRFAAQYPDTHLILLGENQGGEAFNAIIPSLTGAFVHFSENDQIFQPGWCEYALQAFDAFPRLGQLSLHAPMPTDEEAWVGRGVQPQFKKSCLVYKVGSVGTSCIIRRPLFNTGLQMGNIVSASASVKLPDDAKLSADIRKLGYWIGCSDRYRVRNIGHEANEIKENPTYYQVSYDSKPSVGMHGLKRRLKLQEKMAAINRKSLILADRPTLAEITPQPVGNIPSRYWSMFDSKTPEVEVVDFLYSLVRLVKPRSVLETQAWLGHVSLILSKALTENGFGYLTCFESEPEAANWTVALLEQYTSLVTFERQRSERFRSRRNFDLAIFNSSYEDQEEEFFHAAPYLKENAFVLFTGERPRAAFSLPKKLEALGGVKGLSLPTPRGIYLGTYNRTAKQMPSRIVFCLSAGHSGTGFLCTLLKPAKNLVALHEPEPKYQWETPKLPKNPIAALQFVEQKINAYSHIPAATYLEASHYVSKGFLETFLEKDIIPDLIVLQRDSRKIAESWFALGANFHGDRRFVLQHMLHPEDRRPLFLPMPNWEAFSNYQLCYWYALESIKRNQHYQRLLSQSGAAVFHTSIEQLNSREGLEALLNWLGVDSDPDSRAPIFKRANKVVNEKSLFKNKEPLRQLQKMDLNGLEAAVKEQCNWQED